MTRNDPVLQLLALARRADKVVLGEDAVIASLRDGSARLVFLAKDASERTIDEITRKAFYYHVTVNNDYDAEALEHALGREVLKNLAVTDAGFARALRKKMKEMEADDHGC